ncbi:MAG: AsmA family protein [Sulfuricaulis sp.]
MKKSLKILGLAAGGLIALFVVLAIALTLLFDPNDYKDDIIKAVKDKTGRELRIDGELGWSFFPWVGFETGRLELANAPGFGPEPFARLDGAGAKVELLPLLRMRVSVDTVFLDGLKLNLAKNAAGKSNWDDLLIPADKEKPAEKPADKPASSKEIDISGISINRIDIRKADVTWKDQASKAQYAVRNLNLQTGKIVVGEPVDIHLAFDLESGQPPVSKHLDLKSRISLDLKAQKLEVTNLALAFDESRLSGTLGIRNFDKPAYRVDLALDQIDLDHYMPPAAPAAAGTKPDTAAPAPPVEIPLSLLRSLDVQGKLGIQKLKAMNLRSNDVVIQVSAKDGLITLGPNQAKLYNGKYAGRTSLDVRGKTPLLTIDESVSGIELAPALKDALQFDKFSGSANLSAKITAQGLDARQIKETLNGSASFAVQNGVIKGMDLRKMIDTIEAAKRDKSYQKLAELSPQPGDETGFSHLAGTAQIKNGIVQNNDLKIQSPKLLNISGKGSADLPKETLDYTVTVGAYPIIIDGPFAKPRFRPDWNAILKGKVEEKKTEIKEKAEQKLEQKLKDKLKLFKK